MNLPSPKILVPSLNLGNVQTTHKCCGPSLPLAAASRNLLDKLTNELIKQLWNKDETVGTEGKLIVAEALELVDGLKSGYGTTIGYNTPDTLAYQLMEYNLFEFSASKTEARLAAMTDLLIDQEKNGIRSEDDFKKLANERVANLNQNYLTTEYNLSVAVGQNSAAYHRFMAEKDDFPFVEYQTIGDSSVRNEHAKLNGKVFSLSDPEAMKLWPPNGYNCRCEMLQTNTRPKNVTSGKLAQEVLNSENANWSKSQFNINRGDLKQVFTKKQFYSDIKGLPEKLDEMTFEKYDLKKWDLFKLDLNPIKLDKSITPDNAKELFKKVDEERFMRFKDYYDRKIILKQKNFDKHTTGVYLNKQENRHQLFANVQEVMNKPDEVWLYKTGNKVQSRYVRFYQDTILVVDTEITNSGLEIMTWYQGKIDEKELRKGLLIKKGKDL